MQQDQEEKVDLYPVAFKRALNGAGFFISAGRRHGIRVGKNQHKVTWGHSILPVLGIKCF